MSDTTIEIQTKEALKGIQDSLREQNEKVSFEVKKAGDMAEKTKQTVDELMLKLGATQQELKAVELKLADQKNNEPQRQKSYGEQAIENEGFKKYVENGSHGSMKMSFKTITSANAGRMIRPLWETETVNIPRRTLTIRDLLNVVPIATSSVDYPRQTVRTNAAAMVAEGAVKPYSQYEWGNASAVVKTMAHLTKITRQAFDDAPRLAGEVDSEMRYGLQLVEEAQLLSGNNVGENLNGLIPQATAYVAPIVIAGATNIDVLRLAALQAAIGNYPADGIVLSLQDWAKIELTKDLNGSYIFANPQGVATPNMWGLPVVASPAMALGAFLVGSFRFGATLYDRMGIEVLLSSENADDFEKNLLTMRAEQRLALAVKRPASFISGTFA